MNNKFERELFCWSLLVTITFFAMQLLFSLRTENTLFSSTGFWHFISLVMFLGYVKISSLSDIRVSLLFAFFYQLIGTFLLYYYFSHSNMPLGIDLADAYFYDAIARESIKLDFYTSIENIIKTHDIGDVGFTQFTRLVYFIPGDPILNMKIMNVVLSLISCFLIYKISIRLGFGSYLSKLTTILYSFNPSIIYFSSSGLKEALFQFVVVTTVLYSYSFVKKPNFKNGVIAFILIVSTSFFRVIYPIFFLFGFSLYFYFTSEGKNRTLAKISLIFVIPIFSFVVWLFVGSTLQQWFSLNLFELQAARLGRDSVSILDYILLAILGIVGPIPSFNYDLSGTSSVLLTLPHYIKVCLSLYLIIGIYKVIREKLVAFIPLISIFILNYLMLIISAATLDIRYIYPISSVIYILIGLGLSEGLRINRTFTIVYFILSLSLVYLYNVR